MRNILGTDSYMNKTLPEEMLDKLGYDYLELEKELGDEFYYNLEQFANLYDITCKWHKIPKNNMIKAITILSKDDKDKLSNEELEKYHLDLKKHYIYAILGLTVRKFVKLSDKEEEQLNDDEYLIYLKELRLKYDKSKINNMSLEKREKIAPILRLIMMASAKMGKLKIYKLNDKIPDNPSKRPIIFVLSHVGKDDQTVFSTVISEHYTILSGDYESLHNKIEGKVCELNGILYFDMRSKEERKEINKRVEEKLASGDNILCSMEAAWNLSSNIPVTELFDGMIRVALAQNALILPVGIERFNMQEYGINVASNFFDPKTYENNLDSKEMLKLAKEDLRINLADIKMQLYFHPDIQDKIQTKRDEIGNYDEYNERFKQDILYGWTFDENAINSKKFHSKEDPNLVFGYVTAKYDNLVELYNSINNNTVSSDMKNDAINKFKTLLVQLVQDIKNESYPNDIHNKLLEKFLEINLIMSNSDNVSTKTVSK